MYYLDTQKIFVQSRNLASKIMNSYFRGALLFILE